jgi:dTDP-4-amino-4,6-dideoxygalactose transaminase
MACFSFFPSKNLGGFGDGGMVTTNESKWAERLRVLRNHGFSPKYFNKVIGGNFRLDALQAAVLRVKLRHLDAWSEARRQNASYYRELLLQAGCAHADPNAVNTTGEDSTVRLPCESPHERHVFNQFVICSRQRDQIMKFLQERRIGTEIYYPQPMHLQECFAYLGYGEGAFPASEAASRESLALPIYAELTIEQQQTVVAAVVEAIEHCRQSTKTNEDCDHRRRPTPVH